jgi:DNA-binding NtrC family response regulator
MSHPPAILLVDDDQSVRETMADLLEMDGFTVIQAVNAAEALTLLRQEGGCVDLLVTDLSMPGDDGIALIQQARRIHLTLPAILLTGYAEQVSSVAMSSGGFHILRKPVQANDLLRQIMSLLNRP